MFHITQARMLEKMFLNQRADHEVLALEEGGGGTLCCFVCERCLLVFFLLCEFFPQRFFPCRCVGPPCYIKCFGPRSVCMLQLWWKEVMDVVGMC